MDLDSLLKRIKVNGRGLSLDRLHWWCIIALTRLFGRQVEIENSGGEKIRILPVVWNRKVHLFGAEHDYLQADFSFQYTLRLRKAPTMALTPGREVGTAPSSEGGERVHVILCHLPARATEKILQHAQTLGPSYLIALAYGGPRHEFDEIRWPHKVYIEDDSLRGPSYAIAYQNLTAQMQAYLTQLGVKPAWVLVADYDMLPLKPDYLSGVIALMEKHGAGLGGKEVREVSLSNSLFLTQAMARGCIDDSLNGAGRQPIYHCLGCGLLFRGECFDGLFDGEPGLGAINFELGALTAASKKGYRLLSFDAFGDEFKWVRYRPVFSAGDAREAADAGAPFIHPIKEVDQFLAQQSTRRGKPLT
jgi:hypothetical protein